MARERGDYRSLYAAMVDGPDYQALTPAAKLCVITLRLTLGPLAIGVCPGLVHALEERTGYPADVVAAALDELEQSAWVRRERNVVWVVRGLAFEPQLRVEDPKHRKSVQRRWAELPNLAIRNDFRATYADWFDGEPEAPPEPLRSPSRASSEGPGTTAPAPEPAPEKTSVANATGAVPRVDISPSPAIHRRDQRRVETRLMGLVRQHLYRNGRPPRGWDEGRDVQIIRLLLANGRSEDEIGTAIEGVPLLREEGRFAWLKAGESATMRTIHHTAHGLRYTFDLALEEAVRRDWRRGGRGPETLGAVMRRTLKEPA